MAQHGAALQSYNQELVKHLEDLIKKRNDLQCVIEKQEEEKIRVQKEIERLSYKLVQLNESLVQRIAARDDYDRLIAETEGGYVKILESSQVLLSLVKREASCLDQNVAKPKLESSQVLRSLEKREASCLEQNDAKPVRNITSSCLPQGCTNNKMQPCQACPAKYST